MGNATSGSGQWCSSSVTTGAGSWVLDCSACSVGEELNFGGPGSASSELTPGPPTSNAGPSAPPAAPHAAPPVFEAQQTSCTYETGLGDGGTGAAQERPSGGAVPSRRAAPPPSPGVADGALPRGTSTASSGWNEASPSRGLGRMTSSDSPDAAQRRMREAPPDVQRARPTQSVAKPARQAQQPVQPPSPKQTVQRAPVVQSPPVRQPQQSPCKATQAKPPQSMQAGLMAEPKLPAKGGQLEIPLPADSRNPEETAPIPPLQPPAQSVAAGTIEVKAVPAPAAASAHLERPQAPAPEAPESTAKQLELAEAAARAGRQGELPIARALLRGCYARAAERGVAREVLQPLVRSALTVIYRSAAVELQRKRSASKDASSPRAGGILKRQDSGASSVGKTRSVGFSMPVDRKAKCLELQEESEDQEVCGATRGELLSELREESGDPEVCGTLRVRIFAAHNLAGTDGILFRDSQTHYVIARVGQVEHRTLCVRNDSDPTWSSGNEFTFEGLGTDACKEPLHLEVMSANSIRRDQSLGKLEMIFSDLSPDDWHWQRQLLQGGRGGELEFTVRFDPDKSPSKRQVLKPAAGDLGKAQAEVPKEVVRALLRGCYEKAA